MPILAKLRQWAYRQADFTLVVRPLDDFEPRYVKRWNTFEISQIAPEDIKLSDDPYVKQYQSWLDSRLHKGDVGFWARKEGTTVGFTGLTFGPFNEGGLPVEPAEGECILTGIDVFPPYRRTPAAGILLEAALIYAKQHGFKGVRSGINLQNAASLNIAKHLGFLEVGRVRVRCLFSRYVLPPKALPVPMQNGTVTP